ncbi:SDR family oxidoreductase [Streptomyces actinomycinicus]|uniref:SDR family oxidoreductase n=2 Tax=Streptomyces actinomycinicus TaxID=1695166 RepID=A0A937EP74_9ACTN|nr:SDR family oxidoreductase [Streptomyces actinomycinicus]
MGLAVARAFAARGDRVAVAHRSGEAPDGLLSVPCDVTDTASVAAAFARAAEAHGPVEVLVANAGTADDGLLIGMKDEVFQRVLDTNLTGAFRTARQAARGMVRRRGGRIVFVASVAAHRGYPGQSNYAASKAGLVGLARVLARELGPYGITANVIAPGLVDAGLTRTLSEQQKERITGEVPLGRAATADEIAAAVLWLASPEASYVTGVTLAVDGGLGIGH